MKLAGAALRDSLPSRAQIRPVMLEVLAGIGGEATVFELDEALADYFGLSQEQRAVIRSGSRTEFAYRCAWARTEAKRDGWLTQTRPRTWALVPRDG